ncbi:MAG TPA: sugar ABC transporter permease [Acidimicrobiia bacterium]|nr:sugar ABC transporter permease [Acidimicrobiia bacterium]
MAVPAITGKGAAEHPAAPFLLAKKSLAKRRGRAGLWFVMPWIVGFFLWYAIPMLASLWFSFTDFNLVSNKPTEFVGLRNWAKLFSDPEVRASVLVTVRFGLIALPVAVLFPMGLAYLLVNKNLKVRETFRALFFMPSIIPFVAAVLIFGGVMNSQIGWVNKILDLVGIDGPRWFLDKTYVYPALVFIGLWGVGNAMIIFIASMNSVPSTLYDAAKIDGASEWQSFRHVTLPLISPIIFYNLVIALIGLFNYFVVPFVLYNGSGDPGGATNFYALYFFRVGFQFFNMGYAATLAWALFVAAIAITGLLFWSAKYWVHYEYGRS